MYSQSAYPIQRVEGNDTVVVMTRAQAMAMNKKFINMDSTIKDYKAAYSLKYFQLSQVRDTIMFQDSVIMDMEAALKAKPKFKPMTKTDIFMSTYFVLFTTVILTLTL